MTLQELADHLSAELTSGSGATAQDPGAAVVIGLAGIEEAGPAQVTFVANPRYAGLARTSKAAALIVEPGFPSVAATTLRVKNPYLAWAKALALFYPAPRFEPGIHPLAAIDSSATLGQRAHVGAFAVIGAGCRVGDDAVILSHAVLYPAVKVGNRFFAHAHAVVREGCTLGDDVTLQNGAVIGADGFGFAKDGAGHWQKIVQAGPAILGNRVEVQSNACVDRASIGSTRIADGVKIDNLVQVGHGSTVGENTLLCAQVGLAGSTTIGRNVILAGQVGVAGHLTVGDGAVATAQTGIPSDVAPGAVVSGYPAMDNRAWLRTVAAVNRLPDLLRRLKLTKAQD